MCLLKTHESFRVCNEEMEPMIPENFLIFRKNFISISLEWISIILIWQGRKLSSKKLLDQNWTTRKEVLGQC